MVKTNIALKEREIGIDLLKMDLEDQKLHQEQLLAEQKNLQEHLASSQQALEKTRVENAKIKDEVAFLLTTNAMLERVKGIKNRLPGTERSPFVLNTKDAGESVSRLPVIPLQTPERNRAENANTKDEVAYLLTTIALQERVKGLKYRLPDVEGTSFTLNAKEDRGTIGPKSVTPKSPEGSKAAIEMNNRSDK